ncbi:unnamed protein product [Arctia plantaginis]|uniref:Integrase zinc-binding domain-containing protein n=1 Tax=Arctia plantaginis TaxID=874455 RepID=A0A8S1BNH9_ARCPL|nr:unnamed protein product [Arctia plantaginis]
MKSIARSYVYWPNLDVEIEILAKECSACCQRRDASPRSLFGEFQRKHYLVTVDAHSKWIEVQKMSGTNAKATISNLRELFARFGLALTSSE